MGPVSRKASGRTPGRKGLEVSGRAAWTGRASSLGPPRAGQLPCLSEPGNPRHFLAHAEVGEEGRRLLLSRPQAGGMSNRRRGRAVLGAPGPQMPHGHPVLGATPLARGMWRGGQGQGPLGREPTAVWAGASGPTRQVHTSETRLSLPEPDTPTASIPQQNIRRGQGTPRSTGAMPT